MKEDQFTALLIMLGGTQFLLVLTIYIIVN